MLEVGPGIGSLTVALADAVSPSGEVLALELDRHLLPVLGEVVDGLSQVRVAQGDALTVDYEALLGDARPWSMVSNLASSRTLIPAFPERSTTTPIKTTCVPTTNQA